MTDNHTPSDATPLRPTAPDSGAPGPAGNPDTLSAENARLRQIISDCAKSLGNGSAISPECSVDFLSLLPAEIALHVATLKARGAQ